MKARKSIRSFLYGALALAALSASSCAGFPEPSAEKNSLLILPFTVDDYRTDADSRNSWADEVQFVGPETIKVVKYGHDQHRLIAVSVKPGTYSFASRRIYAYWSGNAGGNWRDDGPFWGHQITVPADSIVLLPFKFNLVFTGRDRVSSRGEEVSEQDQETFAAELSDTIGFSDWIGKLLIGFGQYVPRMTLSQDQYRLRVLSDPPGAELIVDSARRGETPTAVELSAGRHLVEVRKDNYASWRNYVELDSDQEVTMSLASEETLKQDGAAAEVVEQRRDQYGLVVSHFHNAGSGESDQLGDVFPQSLSALLHQDKRLVVRRAPEGAAAKDERATTMLPDFSPAVKVGADLMISGDYVNQGERLMVHATLYDVQKESAKADLLYTSTSGLSLFDAVDEMAKQFTDAVDNVLPQEGRQILERKETVETEIIALQRKVSQKDVIEKRAKKRNDFALGFNMGAFMDDYANPSTGDNMSRFSGPAYGLTATYALHFSSWFGWVVSGSLSMGGDNNAEQSAPMDFVGYFGPELTMSNLSSDIYIRPLFQYRYGLGQEIFDTSTSASLGTTSDFKYYGFTLDSGVRLYGAKRYSAAAWYFNMGCRYSPYLVSTDGDLVPFDMTIYVGVGVRP